MSQGLGRCLVVVIEVELTSCRGRLSAHGGACFGGLDCGVSVCRARAWEEAWRGPVTFSTSRFSDMVMGAASVKVCEYESERAHSQLSVFVC